MTLALFRTQPILDATSLNVCALEVLCRNALPFNDESEMLKVDVMALEYASQLREQCHLRVHCNMELSSLVSVSRQMLQEHVQPGVVIELVERNDLLKNHDAFIWIQEMVRHIRTCGGLIAMDDITLSEIEINAINALQPEILKVVNSHGLLGVRKYARKSRIVAEHIETTVNAEVAKAIGAHELQGFWCDARVGQPASDQERGSENIGLAWPTLCWP